MGEETFKDQGGDIRWRLARHLLDGDPARPDVALAAMCGELADAFDGSRWCYVISGRHAAAEGSRPRDEMLGHWKTLHVEYDPRHRPEERRAWEALRERVRFADDPGGRHLIATAGQVRVQLARQFYAAHSGAPIPAFLDDQGVLDRVVGITPMTPNLEVWVIAERASGALFDDDDAALLIATLPIFARVAYRLCLQRGWLENTERLTPRERDALAQLLAGRSEADCAVALGLRVGSVHQMVVRVFRKLGVRTRAELMARCLGAVSGELVPLE